MISKRRSGCHSGPAPILRSCLAGFVLSLAALGQPAVALGGQTVAEPQSEPLESTTETEVEEITEDELREAAGPPPVDGAEELLAAETSQPLYRDPLAREAAYLETLAKSPQAKAVDVSAFEIAGISLGANQRDVWRALKKEFKDSLIRKSKQSNLYKIDDHTYVMVPDTIRYLVKERRDCHVASENGIRTCKTLDVRLPVVRNESTHYVALTQTLQAPIKMETLWAEIVGQYGEPNLSQEKVMERLGVTRHRFVWGNTFGFEEFDDWTYSDFRGRVLVVMIDENKNGEVHEYWQLLTDNILDQINYKQNLNKARAEHSLTNAESG